MKKAAVPSILVAVVLVAVAVIAEAQQPKKVPRIGFVSGTDPKNAGKWNASIVGPGTMAGTSIIIYLRHHVRRCCRRGFSRLLSG
jgi:hypothetical protein